MIEIPNYGSAPAAEQFDIANRAECTYDFSRTQPSKEYKCSVNVEILRSERHDYLSCWALYAVNKIILIFFWLLSIYSKSCSRKAAIMRMRYNLAMSQNKVDHCDVFYMCGVYIRCMGDVSIDSLPNSRFIFLLYLRCAAKYRT